MNTHVRSSIVLASIVSSPQLGTGYFKNFARTQREGFDADLDGRIGHLSFGLDWTWLQATYESPATADGSANDTSDAVRIPGTRWNDLH